MPENYDLWQNQAHKPFMLKFDTNIALLVR